MSIFQKRHLLKGITKLIFFKNIYIYICRSASFQQWKKKNKKKKNDEHQLRINLHMRQEHKHQYLLWSFLMILALRNTLCKQLLYPSTLQPKTHYHFQTSLKHMPRDFHQLIRIRTTSIKNNKNHVYQFYCKEEHHLMYGGPKSPQCSSKLLIKSNWIQQISIWICCLKHFFFKD